MTNSVTMTAAEHAKIQRELEKLHALEAGGVDNWEWYDESLKGWRKENAHAEMISNLIDDFTEIVDELSIEAEVDFPGGPGAGANVHIPHNSEEATKFINLVISKYKEFEKENRDD